MANTSISNLAAGAAVSATDLLPNVQTVGVGPVKTTAAQLKTFMSDTPTFATSATGPLFIGGTGTTSTLTLRSTSGVGTTGADIVFQAGNNGATEIARFVNSGNVGIGCTPLSVTKLQVSVAVDKRFTVFDNAGTAIMGFLTDAGNWADIFISGLTVKLGNSGNERMSIPTTGSVVVGTAALATSATNGFLYFPSCAGTPTGVPTSYTGRVPIIYDTTNNKIYVYNGGWKATAALT